jgi:hypothetical protein
MVYDQQVKPHPTKPPDFTQNTYPNKTVFPQPATTQSYSARNLHQNLLV